MLRDCLYSGRYNINNLTPKEEEKKMIDPILLISIGLLLIGFVACYLFIMNHWTGYVER